ncbi:S41 family peptidase [Patescibacteria group bacterium]|nr:S41 family peptidase [Patescibacteria group bacterium]
MNYRKIIKKNNNNQNLLIVLSLLAAFAGGLLIGYLSFSKTNQVKATETVITEIGSLPPDQVTQQEISFTQFWEMWKLLKLKYYQDITEEQMFYGAMSGLANSLEDPYTSFFEPKTAKEFSDSLKGEFEGIGAEIGIRENQLQIIAPLPDTPADRAGLMAGDYILAINGTSTENMTTEQAVMLIRGKKGSTVTLQIGRLTKTRDEDQGGESEVTTKPEIFDVDIVRDRIFVKSVELKWEQDDIAVVKISSFNQETAQEFSEIIDKVVAKNPKGLILDLRNNPGGFLDRSIAIAGEWVGSQTVVMERRKGKIIDEFHGTGSGRLSSIPTVVLANEGSASASEIVAGALQDYGLAYIIGNQTFGKGSVQDYTEFEDGSAVKITIAEWLTPLQRSINSTGITPDFEIDRTLEDYNENRDPQLDKAIEYIKDPNSVKAEKAEQSQ